MKYEQPTMDVSMWKITDIITTSDPDLEGWGSGNGSNIDPNNY